MHRAYQQSKKLLNRSGPLIALLVIYGLFCIFGPESFSSLRNLETIGRQSVIVGSASLGMTLVIVLGGLDLSIGSVIALSTVVIAAGLNSGRDPAVAAIEGVALGALAGALNGLLVTGLKLTPFIVTLGSLLLIRGTAKGIAHEQKIDAPLSWLNELLMPLGAGQRWMLVAPGVWITLIAALLTALMLRSTVLGRHIVAIGSNERAARMCGVRVERIKFITYTINGLFAGLAGLFQFSRLTVGDPTVAIGLELDVIAAVVIGGGSLSGGQGSVGGSLIGAVLMTVIRSGCSQIGLPTWVQEMVTGGIIVIAVFLDRVRQNSSK